jgi:putative (di)nucleoside polyphosphate hydrolase
MMDRDDHPEFVDWRWARLADLPALVVAFKRPVYEAVAQEFAAYART